VTVCPDPHGINRLTTVHSDKRFVPPMSGHAIVRYPHMSSDISEDVKYSIVVGRFHSFRRALMSLDSFVHSMADVVFNLAAKGYDVSRMLQNIRRCCLHHPELFGLRPLDLHRLVLVSTAGVRSLLV